MNCIEADNVIKMNVLPKLRKLKMSQEVIESLIAQLEASKQMYNEALNSLYQVRTHNVALQRQMSVINTRLTELQKSHAAEVKSVASEQEVNPTPMEEVKVTCEHLAEPETEVVLEDLSA